MLNDNETFFFYFQHREDNWNFEIGQKFVNLMGSDLNCIARMSINFDDFYAFFRHYLFADN